MSYKHSYIYYQVRTQIFVCVLALHLAQCHGSGSSSKKSNSTQELLTPHNPLPVNQLDEKIVTAITNNFLKNFIKDLQAGKPVDIAQQDPTPKEGHGTPIMAAVKEPKNQVEILQYLLSRHQGSPEELKHKINQSNAHRETALLLAMRQSKDTSKNYYNPAVIKLLVKNGADPYANDGTGITPVAKAVISGNLEALQSLLNDEVGYDGICLPKSKNTPLHIAAHQDNKGIVKYLLSGIVN